MRIKYKGRSFSSGRSLASAITRDFKNEYERRMRSAAAATGVRLVRTAQGLRAEGTVEQLKRFNNRLAR